MNSSDATSHIKENKVPYLINLFGSVIPILMFLIYGMGTVDSLATEKEVDDKIDYHLAQQTHPISVAVDQGIQKQLNNIQSFQIEERIEKQLIIVCRNPSLRDALEPSIRQLIRDYNAISPTLYRRPTCEQLGVSS